MRKWLPLLTVCLGTFMLLVDVTIVNVALPDMQRDLGASFSALQWVVDGYALAMAALMLGAGSIGDLVGHRSTYLAGMALFSASSLVCGIAPNSAILIAARIVQGIGATAMASTTLALLNSSYADRDRGVAYGVWGAIAGAAAAVGPIIGGVLTNWASWRWIFLVNLPVGIMAIVLCAWVIADSGAAHHARVDVPGIVTFAGAAGAATYALIRANEHGWSDVGIRWTLLVAALALAAFLVVERHSAQPMLDLGLLRDRSFVGVLIAGAALFFAAFGALMYTQIWMQSVLEMSPIGAGLVGLPLSAMAFVVSGGLGRYLHGPNSGRIIGLGLLIVGTGGTVGALLVHGDAGWPALIPGFLVVGTGVGLATATLNSAALSAVPPQRAGMAAGAINTAQQLGMAVAIAALGSVFTARARDVLMTHSATDPAGTARAVAGGQTPLVLAHTPTQMQPIVRATLHTAAAAGVQNTLAVSGTVGLLGGAVVLILTRPLRKTDPTPESTTPGVEFTSH
ncbi:MFS transporter [Nocardia sp. CA-107356]|uniref:MFS transporter n=1 Tax=Nocardia sp. CA-107356 TaxID=3239972 RepID=UPI003D8E41AC